MTGVTLPFSACRALWRVAWPPIRAWRLRLLRGLLALVACVPLAGCETLGYYAHVTGGQLQLLAAREPVEHQVHALRAAGDPAAERLAGQLENSQRVLDYAEHQLALPVGRRYRTYVELGRPYVVWNVFAAPELSLEPHRWCYPVAGCAPYRGYFSAAAAERAAARLAERGMDVYVGGVAAYSTLGWFADPLLSSFIHWPAADVAELLVHELAHGRVWLPGDVAFNESYATFVGMRAAAAWRDADPAASRTDTAGSAVPAVQAGDPRDPWRSLVDLLARAGQRLREIYADPVDPAVRRAGKAAVLAAARGCYAAQRADLGGGRYDGLMSGLNNAVLASISTYEDLVPAFVRLFESVGGNWPAFHAAVAALARKPAPERRAELVRLRDEQVAAERDHQHADQVECEALEGHVADAEAAGAEHDDVRRGRDGQHERT
jgi:predicted aminopeptidase